MRALLTIATLALGWTAFCTTAQADGKAWKAMSPMLPAETVGVVGGNLSTLRGSQAFTSFFDFVRKSERDVDELFATVKAQCKLDPLAVVEDVVIAARTGDDDDAVIGVGVKGVTEAKLTTCLQKVARKLAKVTVVARKKGKVVSYTVKGSDDTIRVAWLAKDVFVMAIEPHHDETLDAFLAGKGAGPALAARLSKVDTTAAWWGAMALTDGNDEIKAGDGTITLVSGTYAVAVHLTAPTAAKAKQDATELKQGLAELAKAAPAMKKFVDAVAVNVNGADLAINATVADQDAAELLETLLRF